MFMQHRMLHFLYRISDTQVPPITVVLVAIAINIGFVPIFDRFASFGLGVQCHDSRFSVLVCSLAVSSVVHIFLSFAMLHSQIKKEKWLLWGFLFDVTFGAASILLESCTQTWVKNYHTQPKGDISCRRVLSGWPRSFLDRKGCSLLWKYAHACTYPKSSKCMWFTVHAPICISFIPDTFDT